MTSIDSFAFHSCTGLTSVTIPDSVTSVGGGVFGECRNLTSVNLGNGVTSIGARMFDECESLTSITLGNGVTSIDVYAFSGCNHLTGITIPDNVTSIEFTAFIGLDGITIYGKEGSYAQTYAESVKIPFAATGEPAKPSAWAEEAVSKAIANHLVPQTLQVKYTDATTRAEFCALAVALYETVKGSAIAGRATFSDTTDVNVQKMAALGVVNGVGDNQFAPNDKLTREQAATMLSRLAEALGKPLAKQAATFADSDRISFWATEQVGQMQATGIMGGVGNNTFDPKGAYTREQSIVTMLRLYNAVI